MISINGKVYQNHSGSGDNIAGNIVISNNKIIIDGNDVTPDSKVINIIMQGNVKTLQINNCNTCNITGNVDTVDGVNGDIDINGSISGNVITTNGDIQATEIKGSVRTINGNIKYKK